MSRDVDGTKRLHEFSALLISDDASDEPLEHILSSAMAIMHADFASIQELDSDRGVLSLLASRNVHPDSAEIWKTVSIDEATSKSLRRSIELFRKR